MKKLIVIFLSLALVLSGCSAKESQSTSAIEGTSETGEYLTNVESDEFSGIDDPDLPDYLESTVYADLKTDLSEEEVFIEKVSAVYLSNEYLQESIYNSKTTAFFGYSIDEINREMDGEKYVFNLDENGQTMVEPLEEVEGTVFERTANNVAIGVGVILICVTVSVVTAGTGAPAVSAILMAGAKEGVRGALIGAATRGTIFAAIEGIKTGDINSALETLAIEGGEGFKIGAIVGAIKGSLTEAIALKERSSTTLSMNDAATIQKETSFSPKTIKQIRDMDEYSVYKEAGATTEITTEDSGIKAIYNPDILNTEYDGITNLERIQNGDTPVDTSGKALEVHHIGQEDDCTFAILTHAQHQENGNYGRLHTNSDSCVSHEYQFTLQKKEIYNFIASIVN